MSEPRVDVGIPTLGSSPFLVDAIESVLAQSLPSWNLVISENGPGLPAVRQQLAPHLRDPRVQHVVTGTTIPRGQHFTRLIRTGSAPYVGLLHDDDRWGAEFLERRVQLLDRNPGCGFAFGGADVIDERGTSLGRKKVPLAQGVHSSRAVVPQLYRMNFITTPAVLVRRSAYEQIAAAYGEYLFADHEMWLRLAARFDVGCLVTWDAEFRIHSAQTSAVSRTEFGKAQLELLRSVEDLPIPDTAKRVEYAKAYAQCALDAVERHEHRECRAYLGKTVRRYPLALIRPKVAARVAVALAALALDGPGRRALGRWRERRRHRGGLERTFVRRDRS